MIDAELPSGKIVEFASLERATKWFQARDSYQPSPNQNFSHFEKGSRYYSPVFTDYSDDPWGRSPYVLQKFQQWKETYHHSKYGD